MRYQAYLIVICHPETNAVGRAEIWSSPEWEQSRCLSERTYVAYAVYGHTFADASDHLLRAIQDERSRYHWLVEFLDRRATPTPTESTP